MPVGDQSCSATHKLSVFNELARVICSKQPGYKLPPKLLDTYAYTK